MTLLPCILDKTWYFLEHLDGYARTGEEFNLDGFCTNLTFDIIGGWFLRDRTGSAAHVS